MQQIIITVGTFYVHAVSQHSYIASYFVCDSLFVNIPKIFVGILDHKNIFYMKKLIHENFTMRHCIIWSELPYSWNFCGRKPLQIGRKCVFCRENFCGLLTGTSKGHLTPNFAEKTFTISYKTSKFVKVLLLKSLLLYRVVFYLVAIVFHYSH